MSGLAGAVLAGARRAPGAVGVRGGRIAPAPGRGARRLPEGWTIAPGLVDLQVNGIAGAEAGPDPDQNAAVARALARGGVTAFCPTIVTRGPAAYRRAAAGLAATAWPADGARSLGAHLEGPFLSPDRPGVHPRGRLRAPDADAVARLAALFRPRVVTLAPELPGAPEAVRTLARGGALVSLGHSAAGADAARAAIAAGARLVTHALNAMRGIESREVTLLTAALGDRRVRVSLIADGVHVAPEVAALLARLLGPRLVLVSDAVAAALAPPGDYPLGEVTVHADGERVTLNGRLGGSAAPLWRGPATLAAAGVPAARALAAACAAPRRLLGLPPALRPGDPADLVVLDAALVPRLTLVGGRVAHADPALPFDVPEPGEPF